MAPTLNDLSGFFAVFVAFLHDHRLQMLLLFQLLSDLFVLLDLLEVLDLFQLLALFSLLVQLLVSSLLRQIVVQVRMMHFDTA